MRNVSSSSSVRRRTNTCFIAVQTAFDTEHHAAAGKAAENCSEVKCFSKNSAYNTRNQIDMHNSQDKCYGNVDNAHQRNQSRGCFDNALAAAQQTIAYKHCFYSADNPRSSIRIIEAQSSKGRLQIVRAQHIKATAIGYNQSHSKEHCQTAAAQSSFDVISRAAVAAVRTTLLVNLCQGAFNKSRSAADNSNNPHPEHSTITAEADSCGNADNITGTYTGRSRYHQSLEG